MKQATFLSLLALCLLAAPSYAATTYVHAGSNLQTAINSTQPGDVLVLDAGATFTGPITLPSKGGSSYITIESSALAQLPAAGMRVSPANAPQMPKIVSSSGYDYVLATAPGASYYNIIGIEFSPADSTNYSLDTMIKLGDVTSAQNSGNVPNHLTIDRCYIHAFPGQNLKRGIGLQSSETSILNSYISDFKLQDQDAQAMAGWNGPGPFHIINNYLEASGENLMFGGTPPSIIGLIPSDIEVRDNYLAKPLSWRSAGWKVKNLFELKNAQRVIVEGNVMENSWDNDGDHNGYGAVVLTVRNDSPPGANLNYWATIQNVDFRNNIVRHAGRGINILGVDDDGQPSVQGHDIRICNNLFDDINNSWDDDGKWVKVRQMNNLTLDHNTVFQNWDIILTYDVGNTSTGFVMTNNIVNYGSGINGQNTAPGNQTMTTYFPSGVLSGNVMIGGSSQAYQYSNFPNNYYPTLSQVGFVDYSNGNYRLSSTSPYISSATDGRAVGCDLDTLAAATGGGFGDNFNDNVMDTSKWYKGVLNVPQSAYNPNVTVLEQNQRLEITPVANTSVWSHNGYVSVATYDFTGARASVQVPQVPTGGTAYAIFTVGIDSDNWYRIATSAGQIKFQDTVNGVKNSTILTYNATQHKYWRIRHNSATDTVDFLTSSDGKAWTTQRSVARQLSVTALHIELDAGTFEPVSNPGKAIFDDLRFERNYWGDDFNDNVQDTLKWYQGVLNLDPSAYNPGVTVLERNNRLEITPIANTSVWSHNGYVSSATYDLTGARVSVQVPQVPTGGTAYAIFAVGIDSNNWYRITTTAGQMNFQDMVGGVKNTSSITYNAAQYQYWRIRHDTASDTILFETSADGVNWTTRRTIARNLSITAVQMELDAGTFEPVSAPGTAVFDNFRFERP
jgi:hypothetical protein